MSFMSLLWTCRGAGCATQLRETESKSTQRTTAEARHLPLSQSQIETETVRDVNRACPVRSAMPSPSTTRLRRTIFTRIEHGQTQPPSHVIPPLSFFGGTKEPTRQDSLSVRLWFPEGWPPAPWHGPEVAERLLWCPLAHGCPEPSPD